jgi:hypothetical protein
VGFYSQYRFDIDQECSVSHHLPPLYGPSGIVIELHWTLISPKTPIQILIERVWEKSRPGSLFGAPCQIISAEDLVLHLCLHAAYLDYFSSGLRPMCDIAWTLQVNQNTINWADLIKRSSEWGVTRSIWLALRIAKDLLDAPVPSEVMLNLSPGDIEPKMIDWATEQVIHPMKSGGKLAAIWAAQSWRERMRVFLKDVFPAPEEMKPYYPNLTRGVLWPMAYLKHLSVVMLRNWLPVWGLITGDRAARKLAEQREHVNRIVRWLEAG